MDDQHDYPTDDTEKLRLILLQLDEAGRQEVYAMIRDLADKAGVPEQPATVAELFEQWKDLWRQADAAPDDAAVNAIADRAFLIEQRAVTLPLTSASDVLALIVMTTDASNELARTSQDALVARAYAEMDAS
jgi:hypothetical protein